MVCVEVGNEDEDEDDDDDDDDAGAGAGAGAAGGGGGGDAPWAKQSRNPFLPLGHWVKLCCISIISP